MPPRVTGQHRTARQATGGQRPRDATVLQQVTSDYVAARATSPQGWESLLTAAAAHLRFGFTAAMSIAAQQDEPEPAGRFEEWVSSGWRISAGQRSGLRMLTGPGEPETAALFTRSQVRPGRSRIPGAVPGAPPAVDTGMDQAFRVLTACARTFGFSFARSDDVVPHTDWATRQITIALGAPPPSAAIAAASRELACIAAAGQQAPRAGTTIGLAGTQAIEAASAAWITLTRLGAADAAAAITFPAAAAWAGTDPRAQPARIILAAGERITAVAAMICQPAEKILAELPPPPAPAPALAPAALPARPAAAWPGPGTARGVVTARPAWPRAAPELVAANQAAVAFYRSRLLGSWAAGYMAGRGFTPVICRHWQIGYAPGGWTALTDHLRAAGFSNEVLERAGLARRSSRGTLIDYFRDRVIFPLRGAHGQVVGFAGRAPDDAGDRIPKYLNTPETEIYHKGEVFFGLPETAQLLGRGARPVIVEGYTDAIAVSVDGGGKLAGLATGGTALSAQQMTGLAEAGDLTLRPPLDARDPDAAGRRAAIRDYQIITPVSPAVGAATLPDGQDPADLFKRGPGVLTAALAAGEHPLADVAVDAVIQPWAGQLRWPEGQLGAARAAARLLATHPPADVARQIARITDRTTVAAGEVLEAVTAALEAVPAPKPPGRDGPGPAARQTAAGDFPQPAATRLPARARHASTATHHAGGRRSGPRR